MDETKKILESFLELLIPRHCFSGIRPSEHEQACLDWAREEFEKLMLDKYGIVPANNNRTVVLPTSAPSGMPPSGEGVKVDINRVP